ncbi:MAG TPA: RhuM family protein [Puia sp.]|nr:RhuM family protein [Puia sp.]
MKNSDEIIIYKPKGGKGQLEVRLENETVWLTQSQMASLFMQTKQNISLHINNIFRENELNRKAVVKESLTTALDGKKYKTTHYNLDVIISVGYRVKSKQGTQFRIWATQVLKDHLIKGFTINEKRLKEEQEQLAGLYQAISIIEQSTIKKKIASDEAKGLLKIILQTFHGKLLYASIE